MMRLTRPSAVFCTPSFARHLLVRSQEILGTDLSAIGIDKLCVYGEPGGSVPEIVQHLTEGYGGAEVYDFSGGTSCLNPIFVSCNAQNGLHFIAPDTAYIELYDREKDSVLPFEDGAEGEFVYTGLDRECGPLVRFKDGDRMRVYLGPCPCGMSGMRINILGRVDDMLLIKGVNVFPSAVRDVVMRFRSVVTGNTLVVKPGDSVVVEPPLTVKVECKGAPDEIRRRQIAERIQNEIKVHLRFQSEVVIFNEGTLPMEFGATGKARILVSES